VEASALHRAAGLAEAPVRSPLLRLRSDEQLITLTRRGNQAAFEALVTRYQPRLLAFCRHMLGSKEDAEDVLQEVFAAAYNAMLADTRPINARPWLYRIARNRSLNHLRKPRSNGQDSMDVFERDNGVTTADTVHRREEFRQIVADVGELPETQRTALLLREIDALSYDQIAEAMDTTVPSVKSLLVRARVSLAEAAEARLLTCAEVRLELGEVAEGLAKTSAPVRRHLKQCKRCRTFRDELKNTTKALAAVYPIGPLVILHKLGLAKLGLGGGAAATTGGAGAGAGGSIAGTASLVAGGAATTGGGAAAAGGAISAGIGTLAGKAAAGVAAAAIVTAGAVEVKHVATPESAVAPAQTVVSAHPAPHRAKPVEKVEVVKPAEQPPVVETAPAPPPVAVAPAVEPATPVVPPETVVQEEKSTIVLPDEETEPVVPPEEQTDTTTAPAPPPPSGTTPPAPAPPPPTSAPPAGGQATAPPPPPAP
jgi:RNA polymerase sigma factor (sigma-70 family)